VINRCNESSKSKLEVACGPAEFSDLLKGYGIFTLESDLKNVFNRFDKKKEGLISFKDFAAEMLPSKLYEKVKSEQDIPSKRFTIE